MIHGGWNFVIAAYAVTLGGLIVLTVSVFIRSRTWAKRARELDTKRAEP